MLWTKNCFHYKWPTRRLCLTVASTCWGTSKSWQLHFQSASLLMMWLSWNMTASMVDYQNGLRPWWPTWRPAHRKRPILTIYRPHRKQKKKTPWNYPKTKQQITLPNQKQLSSSPLQKLKGTHPAVKTPTACLAHLEEESAKKDEEVDSEDHDGIDSVTEEFMVCLARAVKDTQMEEKHCYHCSSLEHFIHDCPLAKALKADLHLNCKMGTAPKKGAQTPQTKVTIPRVP